MSIFTALSGAIAAEERVNTIANNLANIDTAGFKKDSLTFKEYLTQLEKVDNAQTAPRSSYSWDDYNHLNGHDKSYVDISSKEIDFEQGAIKQTGSPLDLALDGEGFFAVKTPSGIAFTRNGSFTLNSQGVLVTSEGYSVLSGQGDFTSMQNAEEIILKGSRVDIDTDGNIYEDGEKTSTLARVKFEDNRGLSKIGSSLFVNNDPVINPAQSAKGQVLQGALEWSNVNPIGEMINMIQANRAFEAYQNVIKSFNEIDTKAVNDLGRLLG